MNTNFKKYILFWLSQAFSQLGSAMTSFALILWVYEQNHSAMSVSLLSFCNYVPYIIVGLFVGTFIDKHSKKIIMLVSDSIAAICSLVILFSVLTNGLSVWTIYGVNIVIGIMNAFQQPASTVAIGIIIPKDKLSQVSGMNSFSTNLVQLLNPVFAAFLFAFGGLKIVLLIDLFTFVAAFLVLLFIIKIPEEFAEAQPASLFSGIKEGYRFLKNEKGLMGIILTMALINFFSRLTYENILSPMILSRSGGNNIALGIVNAAMGIGGIAGGLIVSTGKTPKSNVKMIYYSAAMSFLFGDLTMALGRNTFLWSVAGIMASLPIPFIMAGQNVIMYDKVPKNIQGRIFAIRNAIQFSTIPFAILLGGFLADNVFEPFMQSEGFVSNALGILLGNAAGSGMAFMFMCTGISGFIISCISYSKKEIRKLDD